ncbi:SusC/RagA family TonB-linked outer membrane protein [Galbibacter pacificus]|uniref:TonB-dependent receptor n=1 Tax=Galbibacter pacificus TaxID=2996052 RepID=A0ABT6FMN7_9FLAO|nr:TonB-dependent receptor [Galbibacter pacificus]MDG3581050.1 TonB-dependent receptor [Galbibacter pacificus]MDG3584528.1 TonB-dependent receptor [Galbibacter pacificus]
MKLNQPKNHYCSKFGKLTKTFLLFVVLITTNLCLMGQNSPSQRKIIGTITDEEGIPIPGVSIILKNTNKGTVSDFDGGYAIDIPLAENATLEFNYIGYKTETIPVEDQYEINVVMKLDVEGLDEVVVVGYGKQKKVTVTGAISSITSDEITTTKNENVVNTMTGKIPGVRILQKSSEPGSFDNVYDIRGFGNPLIVIDGVPRGGLERMDPNEIESISVLKDASAAIYGVRAANGVILVTTKRGADKFGKFDINYSVNTAMQQFMDLPDGVNALEYMMLKNEQQKRGFANNFFTQTDPAFGEADMDLYSNGTLLSTDWIGATMKKAAFQNQHNLNINGSGERVQYYFNLGYLDQEGLFKSDDVNYNRWNFRSNVHIKISDNLRAEALLSGFTDEKNQPNKGIWEMFKNAWNQLPTDQLYANNNPMYVQMLQNNGNGNPLAISDSDFVGNQNYINKNFQGQAAIEYDIPGINGLMARGMYSYGFTENNNTVINTSYTLYTYDRENDEYISNEINTPSTVNRYFGSYISKLFQLSLRYNQSFGNHNFSGLLLYEESNAEADNFYAQREFSLGIPYLFAGNTTNQIGSMNSGGLWETVNKGLVGKVNYDYRGKYLVEFSFRYDGSSKFKKGSQWGFFPAASLGWRISEEPFMKKLISPEVLNNLKFRGSYGKLGDDSATGFQYISGYNYPATGYIFGGDYINGLQSRGVVNPNLTWYTAKTMNLGIDFDLWNGLLGGTTEYFVRNRDGLLATRTTTLPGTVGTNLPQENLNSDRTSGFEFQLTHRNNINEFKYNISANISTTRTKLINVQQTPAGNSYENWRNSMQNRYTNIWWGKEYAGQFESYDEIYNHLVNTGGGNQNIIPGDYYYEDLNNDGVIDYKDEHPIAVRDLPLVNFGMTLNASWKGFDVNILMQGATDFYVQYAEQLAEPLMYGRSALSQFMDRWHTINPEADVFDPSTEWVPGRYPAMGSPIAEGTKAVQDATYFRIKSLEIGYTIPSEVLSPMGINKLRVYLNSYNLATFTGLKNSDPERPGMVADGADWNYSQGGYKYPLNRTFNLGFNVSF